MADWYMSLSHLGPWCNGKSDWYISRRDLGPCLGSLGNEGGGCEVEEDWGVLKAVDV